MQLRPALTAAAVLIALTLAGDVSSKLELMQHSFTSPVTYGDLLGNWFMSGATMAGRKAMQLTPGVLGRLGMLWHKEPLLTGDFQIDVEMKITGPANPAPGSGFAMWYVHDNATAAFSESVPIKLGDWKKGMEAQGWTTLGYKPRFDGLGVFFTPGGYMEKEKVSMIGNSGQSAVTTKDLPTRTAKSIPYRNTPAPFTVSLQVIRKKATLAVTLPHGAGGDGLELDSADLTAGGFIGFSAWSGDEREGEEAQAPNSLTDSIEIMSVKVYNLDPRIAGEVGTGSVAGAEGILAVDAFENQAEQTEMLKRLTKMLNNHLDVTGPLQSSMFKSLTDLQYKATELDNAMKMTRAELQLEANGADLGDVKSKIVGLRQVFMKDSYNHRSGMMDLAKEVKSATGEATGDKANADARMLELQKDSDLLKKTIASNTSWSMWFLCIIVVSAGIVVFFLYKRMAYYEKRHFL